MKNVLYAAFLPVFPESHNLLFVLLYLYFHCHLFSPSFSLVSVSLHLSP